MDPLRNPQVREERTNSLPLILRFPCVVSESKEEETRASFPFMTVPSVHFISLTTQAKDMSGVKDKGSVSF